MRRVSEVRGTGLRHTMPFARRFAGVWISVILVALIGMATSIITAIQIAQYGDPVERGTIVLLIVEGVGVLVAALALGLFTTHRLAGPWIALRRALRDVKNGDLERRLRFRASDGHLQEVADEYNAMVAALSQRHGQGSEE